MDIKTGQEAPDFTLQNTEGEKITLSDYIGEKNIVLLFFPLAFTSTCTVEMCTMRDNMKLYNSLDAKIIGISVDSFFTLKEFKKTENLNFTLLSDFNKEVSENYGVLYEDYFGMKGVSKRAAFVINKDGEVAYAEVLDDSGNQPDYDAIQKTLSEIN
jgi:peroxiredoxin